MPQHGSRVSAKALSVLLGQVFIAFLLRTRSKDQMLLKAHLCYSQQNNWPGFCKSYRHWVLDSLSIFVMMGVAETEYLWKSVLPSLSLEIWEIEVQTPSLTGGAGMWSYIHVNVLISKILTILRCAGFSLQKKKCLEVTIVSQCRVWHFWGDCKKCSLDGGKTFPSYSC